MNYLEDLRERIVGNCKRRCRDGLVPDLNTGKVNPCQCLLRFRVFASLEEGGVPRAYHESRLDDYRYKKQNFESFKRVKSYAGKLSSGIDGDGLYFAGLTGVGKTFLVCALLKVASELSYSVQYRSLGQLLSEMADREFGGHESVRQFFECDLLALDEIEKVYKTRSGVTDVLFDRLVRYRYGQKKPILVASNCTPRQLESVHGKSIMSLFADTLETVTLVGSDYRERRVR